MANYKFRLKQRVNTPLGEGTIDTMPYNDTTGVYGVWLDKPIMHETSKGVVALHWEPIPEKYITAL